MHKISIVGYGRFGQVLEQLLQSSEHVIKVFDSKTAPYEIGEVYQSDTVFYAVPISSFEKVLHEHVRYLHNDHLLIDVLSVKSWPESIFRSITKQSGSRYLLTHPMFGPDSASKGFNGLPIVIDRGTATNKEYQYWLEYFTHAGLQPVEMSADEHDQLAAKSQGLTHFIGRLLDDMNFTQTKIDTTGAKQLHQIKTQTCNDTWQLFTDLQTKNPYTSQMRDRLGDSFNKLYNQLLPKHVKANVLTVGIQGGEGSFNEQALQSLQQSTLSDESIDTKYLYTTKNVLDHLHRGEIDLGLFAIQNSVGGLVQESIEACAKHRFDIHHKFEILISHHLMKLPNITDDKINKIMAHPQVLKQCRTTLIDRYPDVEIVSGQGELIDTATAAKALAAQNGEISSTIAILGPKILSDIYDLEIIDSDLQDNQNNLTEFILASRPGWQDL